MSNNSISINSENWIISKNNTKNKSYRIKNDIINNINNILSSKNINETIKLVEKFKENWIKVYQKHWNSIDEKELLLSQIIGNISILLNNLKIERVYNNSTFLNTKNKPISNIKDITQMLCISETKILDSSVEWGSCNEWVDFVYNLISKITQNDSDIKYTFQVNTNDAHWILYIDIWSKRFSFDSTLKWFTFDKMNKWEYKNRRKYKPKFFNNYKEYKIFSNQEMNKKNILVYDFNWTKFKIIKKWSFIIIAYKDKPLEYINISWLKRISKNISKISTIKYVWKIPNIYNIDQIKEFILSRIKNDDKDKVKIILNHLHEEKLLQFFNLNNV